MLVTIIFHNMPVTIISMIVPEVAVSERLGLARFNIEWNVLVST